MINHEEYIQGIAKYAISYELVGSRITCNPPPIDTDQDVLVLLKDYCALYEADLYLYENKFSVGGSDPEDAANKLPGLDTADAFLSYKTQLYLDSK